MPYLIEVVGPIDCALRDGGVRSLAYLDPYDNPQVRPPRRSSRLAPTRTLLVLPDP